MPVMIPDSQECAAGMFRFFQITVPAVWEAGHSGWVAIPIVPPDNLETVFWHLFQLGLTTGSLVALGAWPQNCGNRWFSGGDMFLFIRLKCMISSIV